MALSSASYKFRDPVVVGGALLVEMPLDHRHGLVPHGDVARFPRVLLRHALGHERHLVLSGRARRRLVRVRRSPPPPAPPGLLLPGAALGQPVFASVRSRGDGVTQRWYLARSGSSSRRWRPLFAANSLCSVSISTLSYVRAPRPAAVARTAGLSAYRPRAGPRKSREHISGVGLPRAAPANLSCASASSAAPRSAQRRPTLPRRERARLVASRPRELERRGFQHRRDGDHPGAARAGARSLVNLVRGHGLLTQRRARAFVGKSGNRELQRAYAHACYHPFKQQTSTYYATSGRLPLTWTTRKPGGQRGYTGKESTNCHRKKDKWTTSSPSRVRALQAALSPDGSLILGRVGANGALVVKTSSAFVAEIGDCSTA